MVDRMKQNPNARDRQTAESGENPLIVGRNAVLEALRAGRELDTIYLCDTDAAFSGKLRALARDAGCVVKAATRQKLDAMTGGLNHQGVAAAEACAPYVEVEDLLAVAEQRGRPPFLVVADEIEDPHNLGAIIRTAEAVGADGLILPKRRSASLNATVHKTSAGAASVLKVARVANLAACLRELKKKNIWVYGADMDGTAWNELDYRGGVALVIGSEGRGLSRVVKEECDFVASLPMAGQINSLNASVAAGVLLYEAARQRGHFDGGQK